jgi:hypothetical protein
VSSHKGGTGKASSLEPYYTIFQYYEILHESAFYWQLFMAWLSWSSSQSSPRWGFYLLDWQFRFQLIGLFVWHGPARFCLSFIGIYTPLIVKYRCWTVSSAGAMLSVCSPRLILGNSGMDSVLAGVRLPCLLYPPLPSYRNRASPIELCQKMGHDRTTFKGFLSALVLPQFLV